MKKYLLHIFIFTAITFVYGISIYIYGLKNTSIYNILLFLFASPFLEEFIFRGIVQKNIQKYIKCTFFSYISLSNIITYGADGQEGGENYNADITSYNIVK